MEFGQSTGTNSNVSFGLSWIVDVVVEDVATVIDVVEVVVTAVVEVAGFVEVVVEAVEVVVFAVVVGRVLNVVVGPLSRQQWLLQQPYVHCQSCFHE